ncbi:Asp/Glu racemase [Yoonia sp.]|uniref:maleate cis-trans isomerase family protein n=1 Tax=Yoonia sp. TaxID=2212373 RepID=UPI0023A08B57|nr:Asp/Glu racemase [Yoonia sp.]MDE0852313.1 Asp/Glu racemase [Yoonia sp.]
MALSYTLSEPTRKRIGLAVLQTDETLEADMRRLLPTNVDVYVTRVPSDTTVTSDSLATMAAVLTGAITLFPPGMTFDAIGYGCTSGTAEIGPAKIAELVKAGAQTAAVTEPVSALIAFCQAQNITRIGLISPYVAEVSEKLQTVLATNGITVTTFASFEEPLERNVVRIDDKSIHTAAVGMKGDFDAIFLSCTNLRTLDVLEAITTDIGKPVLSSNQVLAWHLRQLCGL